MPKPRFTEEPIMKILQEAEASRGQVRELCRKYGIAEQAFYCWRHKDGGLETADAVRLRQLEREKARLKKLVAQRDLELEVVKELLAKKW
jgi:putative transposase